MFRPFAPRRRGFAGSAARFAVFVIALSIAWVSSAHATLAQSTVFPGWTPFVAGSDITITGDTVAKHGGHVSLKLVAAATSPNNGGFSQLINVQPSTKYHFSAWAKGSSPSGSSNHFVVVDQAGTIHLVGFAVATSFWAQKNWDYTTAAGETAILIGFIAEGNGTFWFDDVTFGPYGTTQNIASNPGFETWDDITVPLATDGTAFLNAFASGGATEQVTTTSASTVTWKATDINGVQLSTGSVSTAGGPGSLTLPSVGAGWYSLHMTTPVSSADI
ncbi:MAG TPA: carbohydrate binding domain-containing protein, partial [Rudaea sp.]